MQLAEKWHENTAFPLQRLCLQNVRSLWSELKIQAQESSSKESL